MVNVSKEMSQPGGEEELRFAFGANWADYVKRHFSDERVAIAQRHLLGLLKLTDLRGRTFLDIGCGSGLHSLAALRAGAERIVSFDYDPNSVATATQLHQFSGAPSHWTITRGSVLDDAFMRSLPTSDVVYSWGVLHHTGDMWKAIANAALNLHETSVFYIALYSSDACTEPTAAYWLDVKRKYNRASLVGKRWMEWDYAWNFAFKGDLLNRRSPLKRIREHKHARGMSFWHDVRDWLGGYPMEYAGHKETENFCRERLGLELMFIRAGEANTEYVFRRIGASNYWDDILFNAPLVDVPGPFVLLDGLAWTSEPLKNIGSPERLMLYENGSPIGWANQPRSMIARWGGGRYGVEDGRLIFSTSDNSDPNASEHRYQMRTNFL